MDLFEDCIAILENLKPASNADLRYHRKVEMLWGCDGRLHFRVSTIFFERFILAFKMELPKQEKNV